MRALLFRKTSPLVDARLSLAGGSVAALVVAVGGLIRVDALAMGEAETLLGVGVVLTLSLAVFSVGLLGGLEARLRAVRSPVDARR